jgi:hypothetical protein
MHGTTSCPSETSAVLPDESRRVQPTLRLDFLVVGFAKCGTTTLCSLLAEHPDVYLPARKDFRFFDLPDHERRRTEWEARFAAVAAERVIGDGSIWYTDASTEEISRRHILERFPDVKLIFIARDPVDRIESAYRELHHSDLRYDVQCPFDLAAALEQFPDLVESSRYGLRFDNYRRHVPEEHTLVLFLEELQAAPAREIARCFRFLGVDPGIRLADLRRRLNTRAAKLHDTPRMREMRDDPALIADLRQIPFNVQDQLLPALGLRRRFGDEPLDWDARARALVGRVLAEESRAFLARFGRPAAMWPRVAALRG